jgi:hypothetical protein
MDDSIDASGRDAAVSSGSGTPNDASSLPPEAIALATRFFDGARNGQVELFEQAIPRGLPANLTNDKGDTLVRILCHPGSFPYVARGCVTTPSS